MGINAMENQALQPGEIGIGEKLLNFGKVTLGAGVVVAALAFGAKTAYNHFAVPAPVAALVEKVSNPYTIRVVNQPEWSKDDKSYGRYCINGECVKVKMCTAVSDECGDMTQGKPADYGTGFHTSADGRVRPNPPAVWKWAGQ